MCDKCKESGYIGVEWIPLNDGVVIECDWTYPIMHKVIA